MPIHTTNDNLHHLDKPMGSQDDIVQQKIAPPKYYECVVWSTIKQFIKWLIHATLTEEQIAFLKKAVLEKDREFLEGK